MTTAGAASHKSLAATCHFGMKCAKRCGVTQKETDLATQKVSQAYSIALNEIKSDYDGSWQSITVATDSNCYFGSSTHSYWHGAGFFSFDPRTRELTILADDITTMCGEDLTKTPSQGKIHSPIFEHDGLR